MDVCSESSSLGVSPRYSFSRDLNQTGAQSGEQQLSRLDSFLLDTSSDFNFCIDGSFKLEPSTADELFSNGKILPMEIKNKLVHTKEIHQSTPATSVTLPEPTTATNDNLKKKSLKEFLATSLEFDEKPPKSFFKFKRSMSLNLNSDTGRSFVRSLQFLSRSNSTGSVPNSKQRCMSKENRKQHLQKQTSCGSATTYYPYRLPQKPPLKKNCRYSGNGVRISPVLNFPPPYISRGTVSLFGFGSLLCNGKGKKKKN